MGYSLIAFLVAAGVTSAAHAQPAEVPAPEQAIVVEGKRLRDRQREISDFVNALADTPIKGQLGRFDWAVCPVAVGLGDAQNRLAGERMRKVASEAGIDVAAAPCKPNVFLIVTSDKRQLIESLHETHPAYFEGIQRYKVARLARSSGPAAAWQVEGLVDADGVEVPQDKLTGQYVVERTAAPSRLTTQARPHFIASVVVVDIDALEGLTVTQLADYAAMRAFARTDPDRLEGSSVRSILTVLDAPMGSATPITLTGWDLAFLKALYGSAANRFAFQQRNEMKHLVAEELEERRARAE